MWHNSNDGSCYQHYYSIMLGVHEETKRDSILSWWEPDDQHHFLISRSKWGRDRGWDRVVVFFLQKTKLGFLYEWNLELAAQPPSSLPDHSPVSWTMWSPVAQVATDHVESWKSDFKLLCRKCGKHCTLASDGFWFSFIFLLPTIFCEEHCGWSNWKILWFS